MAQRATVETYVSQPAKFLFSPLLTLMRLEWLNIATWNIFIVKDNIDNVQTQNLAFYLPLPVFSCQNRVVSNIWASSGGWFVALAYVAMLASVDIPYAS